MSAETRKQLFVGYWLLSTLIAITVFATNGWPITALGWFSDPVFRTLEIAVVVILAPGVLIVYFSLYLVLAAFFLVVSLVLMPIWIVVWLASLGVGGVLLAVPAAIAAVRGYRFLWLKYRDEWLSEAMRYGRTVVEFFAWVDFHLRGFAVWRQIKVRIKFKLSELREQYIWEEAKEEKVSKGQSLEIVRAKIVKLQENYPELPDPPPAYQANRYEGWFMEARKRFEMETFNRTQGERVAVLKRIAELNGLYLTIGRQEGEKQTFEQEQRIRSKRLNLEEMQIDHTIEDLELEREQKRRERSKPAPVPAPAPKPPDIVEEITVQLERAVRTEIGIREVFKKFREKSPELSDWLNQWEAKALWDLKERKWS